MKTMTDAACTYPTPPQIIYPNPNPNPNPSAMTNCIDGKERVCLTVHTLGMGWGADAMGIAATRESSDQPHGRRSTTSKRRLVDQRHVAVCAPVLCARRVSAVVHTYHRVTADRGCPCTMRTEGQCGCPYAFRASETCDNHILPTALTELQRDIDSTRIISTASSPVIA
jgi:hypothetical protein